MSNIESIAPLSAFLEHRDNNLISLRPHPLDSQLVIANYTPKATYLKDWDEITLASRGLIFWENTGEIVARPLKKFFNYGQPEASHIDLSGRIEVANKEDGALGILYTDPSGRLAVSTRGSMTSTQALHATDVFRERYDGSWVPDGDYTFLFEIVYPEGRIVLDYGAMDDLILLGAVHKEDGRSADRSTLESFGWPGPIAESYAFNSVEDVFRAEQNNNREGFVIHLVESDERVKVKFDNYLAIHRLLFNLSERRVWEMMSSGEDIDEWLMQIPDEFTDQAKGWRDGLRNQHKDLMDQSAMLYADLFSRFGEDKKAVALELKSAAIPSTLMSLVFGRFSGWDDARVSQAVWKILKV